MMLERLGRLDKGMRSLAVRLRDANRRLVLALACYFVLALVAGFALDGYIRIALWVLFAWLAFKTIRHSEDDPMDR